MPIFTPNLGLAKPLPNDPVDEDQWGGQLNGDLDILDSAFAANRRGPNLLFNGSFALNQRQFAGGSLAVNIYGYDRWKGANPGGAIISVSGGVATLNGGVFQIIETPRLAGETVTVSLADPSGTITVTVDNTAMGVITAGSGRRSVTLVVPVTATGNLSLALTTGGAVTFADVQLERGSFQTAYDYRSFGEELARCQRYYEKSFPYSVAPIVASNAGGSAYFAQAAGASINQVIGTIWFKVQKRVSATIVSYNPFIAGGQPQGQVGPWSGGAFTGSETNLQVSGTSPAGSSPGSPIYLHWTAEAEL